MKLTALDPRWLIRDGKRVGFIFKSPTDSKWYQSCFQRPTPPRREQYVLFRAALGLVDPDDYVSVQGCDPSANGTVTPDLEVATFDNITVAPSLDGSKGGLWHGYIRDGELTNA